MQHWTFKFACLSVCLLWCAALPAADTVDYARQIRPILKERCFACHGALKQRAGLRLDTGDLIRQGGDSGASVVPGKSAESLLIDRISEADEAQRMPPEGQPLTPDQIRLIRDWVDAGAPSPADETPEADPSRHWSFQPPVRAPVPLPKADGPHAAWTRNPIDAFLAEDQVRRQVTPLPAAPRDLLLRRVYLDLIGVPPTRHELHAYRNDPAPDAYERVVERLLARPEYGERWGRHWMDIWRYSDWYGRRSVNDVRNSAPHIWRWRDWIIQSLNQDKGYDRMVQEMLAADEIAPEDDELIPATGFIVRNWYSLNYDQWMRDLAEHTGKALLGLRLNCALCHDHKYDPLSQEEYFRFRAFFEPLEFRHDRVPGGPPLTKYLRYKPSTSGSLAPTEAGLARIYEEYPDAETFIYKGGDARDRLEGKPPVKPGVPAILGVELPAIAPVDLPVSAWYPGLKQFAQRDDANRHQAEISSAESALVQARVDLAAAEAAAGAADVPAEATLKRDAARLAMRAHELQLVNAFAQADSFRARLTAESARFLSATPPAPEQLQKLEQAASQADRFAGLTAARSALAAAERAIAEAQLKAAADAKLQPEVAKAETQQKAAQTALATAEKRFTTPDQNYSPLGPQYPRQSTGRRIALAHWITDRRNPLTARVAVNHIWMRHFGRPIVATVADFGRGGAAPTQPELLDWLAVEFMESGWSMKRLHALMVTSQAYRVATTSVADDDPRLTRDKDSLSGWCGIPRRVEAEVIRDSLLSVAGRLDRTQGGPDLDPKQSATSGRRSLYFTTHPEAGGAIKFAEAFDPADTTDCYRRSDSIIPQQALALANSDLVLDLSRTLAVALSEELDAAGEPADVDARNAAFVRAAFEQVLTRSPKPPEEAACLEFLSKQRALFAGTDAAPSPAASVTGAATAHPPATDSADLRSREGLLRALFNHTDFLTVR